MSRLIFLPLDLLLLALDLVSLLLELFPLIYNLRLLLFDRVYQHNCNQVISDSLNLTFCLWEFRIEATP